MDKYREKYNIKYNEFTAVETVRNRDINSELPNVIAETLGHICALYYGAKLHEIDPQDIWQIGYEAHRRLYSGEKYIRFMNPEYETSMNPFFLAYDIGTSREKGFKLYRVFAAVYNRSCTVNGQAKAVDFSHVIDSEKLNIFWETDGEKKIALEQKYEGVVNRKANALGREALESRAMEQYLMDAAKTLYFEEKHLYIEAGGDEGYLLNQLKKVNIRYGIKAGEKK